MDRGGKGETGGRMAETRGTAMVRRDDEFLKVLLFCCSGTWCPDEIENPGGGSSEM